MSHKKQITLFEARNEIHNLSILRSFPSLTLAQSLSLQKNIKALNKIEKSYKESEDILKDKVKELTEDKEISADDKKKLEDQINADYKTLLEKKYQVEFQTVKLSTFPQDIAAKAPKKVPLNNGTSTEVSYIDCLLDSIGFSIEEDSVKEVEPEVAE